MRRVQCWDPDGNAHIDMAADRRIQPAARTEFRDGAGPQSGIQEEALAVIGKDKETGRDGHSVDDADRIDRCMRFELHAPSCVPVFLAISIAAHASDAAESEEPDARRGRRHGARGRAPRPAS